MKTANELYRRTLELMLVVGAGQVASAEDTQIVKDALQPLLSELAASNVAYIPVDPVDDDAEDIPDELFQPLAQALAIEVASAFGLPADPAQREAALIRIRKAVTSGPKYFTQAAEYF